MKQKPIYFLSQKNFKTDKHTLGNKGANLVGMSRLQIPVPDGFIVSTDAWQQFSQQNDRYGHCFIK